MILTRKQILKGNYVYPNDLVKLRATKHFTERLEERGIGIDCIPTLVRVTKDNIYCAEVEGDKLVSVVVRLRYGSERFIFLCFNTKDGSLKTVWFKDKKKGYGQSVSEDSEQAVRDTGDKNEVL